MYSIQSIRSVNMARIFFLLLFTSPMVICLDPLQDLDSVDTRDKNYFYSPLDFYWRDYKSLGPIPLDAIIGGKISNGLEFYIGRCNLKYPKEDMSKKFPCPIIPNRELNKSRENVQILCSSNPDQLKWLNSSRESHNICDNDDFKGIIVDSTHENNHYIGRITWNNSQYLGKVTSGLFFGEFAHHKYYQVLVISKKNNLSANSHENAIIRQHKYDYEFLRQLTKSHNASVIGVSYL